MTIMTEMDNRIRETTDAIFEEATKLGCAMDRGACEAIARRLLVPRPVFLHPGNIAKFHRARYEGNTDAYTSQTEEKDCGD